MSLAQFWALEATIAPKIGIEDSIIISSVANILIMMSKARYRWLLNRLRHQPTGLEESNPDLIVEYSKATGAKVFYRTNEYPRCPQLSRDFDKLVKYKLASRKRSFLYDLNGFMVTPRATYIYRLTPVSANSLTWVDRE
jgi:hypothetical protein